MSQCDRILAVLTDGRPHRMEEIHQRVGFCRLNSRIAELRSRGHVIECVKAHGLYVYRLLSEARSGDVGASLSRASLSGRTEPSVQGAPPSCAGRAAAPAAQLIGTVAPGMATGMSADGGERADTRAVNQDDRIRAAQLSMFEASA